MCYTNRCLLCQPSKTSAHGLNFLNAWGGTDCLITFLLVFKHEPQKEPFFPCTYSVAITALFCKVRLPLLSAGFPSSPPPQLTLSISLRKGGKVVQVRLCCFQPSWEAFLCFYLRTRINLTALIKSILGRQNPHSSRVNLYV